MIQSLRRNDTTFYQTVHAQARFDVLARVSHLNDRMTYGKFEILADVWVQTHNIYILYSLLIFTCLIV
jgi:hypothetical protein